MSFDADAWKRATAYGPWCFTATDPRTGRTHQFEARDLSVEEVARFLERYRVAQVAGEHRRARRVLRRFLRRLFPGLAWWRRGLVVRPLIRAMVPRLAWWPWPDPLPLILALPDPAREALLQDFFAHRGRRTTQPTPPSSGPRSSPPASGAPMTPP